jgi:ABC-type uncharacterized transport system substrate-binding protein
MRCPEPQRDSCVRRREFIGLVGGAAAAWAHAARAQQPDRMRLIGILIGYAESDLALQSQVAAFRGTLAKLGWTEGRNLRIETRWAAGNPDRMRTLAKELVELRPDAILGHTTSVTSAMARETPTIPIVFVTVADPIGAGFAASLAHPGGNVTGFKAVDPAMGGKWVELLKEISAPIVRVGLLFNPATAVPIQFFVPSIEAAASSFAMQVSTAPVHTKDEIEGAIAAQGRSPGGSFIVMPDSFNAINRELIIALASRYGVPTIYFYRLFAESGGLIAYSDDPVDSFRQAAGYIDRILKGATPRDLPIQQPTKFELVINVRTAKALGLTVPPTLLSRADEVIE